MLKKGDDEEDGDGDKEGEFLLMLLLLVVWFLSSLQACPLSFLCTESSTYSYQPVIFSLQEPLTVLLFAIFSSHCVQFFYFDAMEIQSTIVTVVLYVRRCSCLNT